MGPVTWMGVLLAVGRTVGQVLLALLLSLLNGKGLKRLIALGLGKLSKKTKTETDDKVVAEIEKDWGLDPDTTKDEGKKS